MRWGLIIILVGLCIAGCEPTDPTPELVQIQAAITPTHDTDPTATHTPHPTQTPSPLPSNTPNAAPTITPLPLQEIIIVIKPIPAGYAIPPDAVMRYPWPQAAQPRTAYTELSDVINQVTLVDLSCFEPITAQTIAPREVGDGFLALPGDCPQTFDVNTATPLQSVVVAVRRIIPGQQISPAAVALRDWPSHMIPPGAYTTLADAIGTIAQTEILPEQLLHDRRAN